MKHWGNTANLWHPQLWPWCEALHLNTRHVALSSEGRRVCLFLHIDCLQKCRQSFLNHILVPLFVIWYKFDRFFLNELMIHLKLTADSRDESIQILSGQSEVISAYCTSRHLQCWKLWITSPVFMDVLLFHPAKTFHSSVSLHQKLSVNVSKDAFFRTECVRDGCRGSSWRVKKDELCRIKHQQHHVKRKG